MRSGAKKQGGAIAAGEPRHDDAAGPERKVVKPPVPGGRTGTGSGGEPAGAERCRGGCAAANFGGGKNNCLL